MLNDITKGAGFGRDANIPKRAKSVSIPITNPERAVRVLLKSCEQSDLVRLYSELGYTLHRTGAITKWLDVMREWLERKGVV